MGEIEIFSEPEFGQIRTVIVDGEPWFVGKDVADALGYSNPSKALLDHVDDDDKLNNESLSSIGQRGGWIINESGLYSLILSSKLPNAKRFKKWVTGDVIPSIRKRGGYITNQVELSPDELMAKALVVAQKALADRDIRISNMAVAIRTMQPKADYFDQLVDRNLLTNFRETAKQLEVKEKSFVTFLLEKKYIYRDKKGKILPYTEKNNGLFEVKECFNEKSGWSGTQTLITPKGRETFRLLMQGME